MVGQYVASDRPVLEVVEDAYSNRRPVTAQKEHLMLPAELEHNNHILRLVNEETLEADRIIDTAFLSGQPRIKREDDGVKLEQNGVFQLLYEAAGDLKGVMIHADGSLYVPAGEDTAIRACANVTGLPQSVLSNHQVSLRTDVSLNTLATAAQGIPMITGLSVGDLTQPDPNRPSMILRRSGGQELWELAKEAGSTVDAIIRANQLQGEPEEDRLLLIPVS